MTRIFLSAPDVGDLETKFVAEAMASGWAAPAGPDLDAFEAEVSARLGVRRGVGLSSGTAALHLALLALGVGRGDVVLTATMTFAATANAITYLGAEPFFVDCVRGTGNVDVALLRDAAHSAQFAGRRIGAVVPVDLLGKCADMDGVGDLAAELDVPLICDAAESMGAAHNGRAAGSFGAASILSFNGNKIMTTSGGGMLVTDDDVLADRVRYLSTQARQPVLHYEHTEVGYNYRLSNLLAALGRAQLARLDHIIARRREIRQVYRDLFAGVRGVALFDGGDDREDNCWLSSIVVDDTAGWSAGELSAHLESRDIESRPLWKPMHLQPVFADHRAFLNGNSEWLFRHGLTLPTGSGMTTSDVDRVVTAIQAFLDER